MGEHLLVQCPDCAATLTVDAATGAVLSHEPAVSKRKLGSLEEAAQEMTRQRDRAADLFAATVEREKHKSEILEKTFKQALEKAQKDPATRPRGIFDDD
jgi:methylthioribose-1-phosphate isomerase